MSKAWQEAWLKASADLVEGFFTHEDADKQQCFDHAAFHFGFGIPSAASAGVEYLRRHPGKPGTHPGPSGFDR